MAYIILKTGEYEFGSMHIESQLDPHDNSKEVQDHKYFIVRLMPAEGVYIVNESECEPVNVCLNSRILLKQMLFLKG
ncbi:hypothetical protein AAB26_18065 [Salmonella enterica subsp. houtenae]|nr:hypothetical protein [Salmonella enterica subsp. enterica serovar Saintpaul]ECH9933651.1 hypothetical protein [Salmonella enterica subsp. houtenae]EDN2201894.1 hypothetical protein [Salmonella enterica]EDW3818820.1 hypothetical protein [Salmonella enterica subsp. houtenae]EGQ2095458.1 hypothetical protein [Salmonella enterica]